MSSIHQYSPEILKTFLTRFFGRFLRSTSTLRYFKLVNRDKTGEESLNANLTVEPKIVAGTKTVRASIKPVEVPGYYEQLVKNR